MSRVSEYEATIAVEAAACKVYEANREAAAESLRRSGILPTAPHWEKLSPLAQNEFRNAVLPVVWAALEALPDNRRDVWLAGYDNGSRSDGLFRSECPYSEEA